MSLRPLNFMLMIATMLLVFSSGLGIAATIDEVKLDSDTLPAGWTVSNEYAPPPQRFEKKFGAEIEAILNQVIATDGASKIQINYVCSPTEDDAVSAFHAMLREKGDLNVMVRRSNIVYELVSANALAVDTVLAIIDPAPLHRVKLGRDSLPATWRLVKVLTVSGPRLGDFEAKLGFEIDSILNQVFFSAGKRVQVNYIQFAGGVEMGEACRALVRLGSDKEFVFQGPDNVVIEVISLSLKLKREAAQVMLSRADIKKGVIEIKTQPKERIETMKLRDEILPKGWELNQEFYLSVDELPQFEAKFDARLSAIMNQYVAVRGTPAIQINYVLCATDGDGKKAQTRLVEMVGDKNEIVRSGPMIVEVISQDPKLKEEVLEILRKKGL